MSETHGIRCMIQRASASSDDRLLNILEELCNEIDDLNRKLEVLGESKADREQGSIDGY